MSPARSNFTGLSCFADLIRIGFELGFIDVSTRSSLGEKTFFMDHKNCIYFALLGVIYPVQNPHLIQSLEVVHECRHSI